MQFNYSYENTQHTLVYHRDENTQAAYEQRLKELHEQEISPEDAILAELETRSVSPQQIAVFTPNKYPYANAGYEHVLLWTDMRGEQALEYARMTFGAEQIVALFQNATSNQSVRGLPHYHVILKK